jgi:hypothetical protein
MVRPASSRQRRVAFTSREDIRERSPRLTQKGWEHASMRERGRSRMPGGKSRDRGRSARARRVMRGSMDGLRKAHDGKRNGALFSGKAGDSTHQGLRCSDWCASRGENPESTISNARTWRGHVEYGNAPAAFGRGERASAPPYLYSVWERLWETIASPTWVAPTRRGRPRTRSLPDPMRPTHPDAHARRFSAPSPANGARPMCFSFYQNISYACLCRLTSRRRDSGFTPNLRAVSLNETPVSNRRKASSRCSGVNFWLC